MSETTETLAAPALAPLALVTPEREQRLQIRRADLATRANGVQIVDKESAESALAIAREIKDLTELIVSDFAPSKRAAATAHKAICEQESRHLHGLQALDATVRGKLSRWGTEERKREEEAEEKRRVEARAAQEQAEREAEEKLLEAAIQVEQMGDPGLAEEVMNLAPTVVVPVAPPKPEPQRLVGGNMQEAWEFEIFAVDALPREYLMPDLVKIRGVVKAMKGATKIPGVQVSRRFVPRVARR